MIMFDNSNECCFIGGSRMSLALSRTFPAHKEHRVPAVTRTGKMLATVIDASIGSHGARSA